MEGKTMAGKLCVYVRDVMHPADLYDNSSHHFAVSIHEVGSNSPLYWKGTNYNWVWLPFLGQYNKVAGEFEIPQGTYLVRGYAWCQNVVTHIAWVQIKDEETTTVNLVPTNVSYCLWAVTTGITFGTVRTENGKYVAITELADTEVKAFEKAATALMAKLPKEAGLAMPTIEELRKRLGETPKS
jgi:hypothetical protein